MSTLTKVFVVLLVILSLALSAATVTFVSTAADFQTLATSNETKYNNTLAQKNAAEANLSQLQTELASTRQALSSQVTDLQQQLANIRSELDQRAVEIARLQGDLAATQANETAAVQALNAAQQTSNVLQTQVAALRSTLDERVQQYAQLNTSFNDLTRRQEVTERERRYIAEQLQELQAQNDRLQGQLSDAGIDATTASGGLLGGAPDIRGVVRNVGQVANVPYAVISVGSEDDVARGMEFKVLSATNGEFLGVLRVDTVEPNEAVGTLTGPRVGEVGPNAKVRTQL